MGLASYLLGWPEFHFLTSCVDNIHSSLAECTVHWPRSGRVTLAAKRPGDPGREAVGSPWPQSGRVTLFTCHGTKPKQEDCGVMHQHQTQASVLRSYECRPHSTSPRFPPPPAFLTKLSQSGCTCAWAETVQHRYFSIPTAVPWSWVSALSESIPTARHILR